MLPFTKETPSTNYTVLGVPWLIFLGVKANHQPAKSLEIILSFGMFRSLGESAEELRIRRWIFIEKSEIVHYISSLGGQSAAKHK